MVNLPQELLQAPELALYQEQIQLRLEEERTLRMKFRDDLSPERKAEFINGDIVVHSPTTTRHTLVRMHLSRLLSTYVGIRRLGIVLDEKILIALTRNDYEPDVLFYGSEKANNIKPAQLIFPPPDFIAEVLSETSAARDRGVKFRDYAAHGVAEYWLLDPETETLEQYELDQNAYALRLKATMGVARSFAVDGFEILVRALFDPEENLRALRKLLASDSSS